MLDLFVVIVLISCALVLVYCGLMLVRNEVTYRIRMQQLDKDPQKYMNGPSYNDILYNLRIWTRRQAYGD